MEGGRFAGGRFESGRFSINTDGILGGSTPSTTIPTTASSSIAQSLASGEVATLGLTSTSGTAEVGVGPDGQVFIVYEPGLAATGITPDGLVLNIDGTDYDLNGAELNPSKGAMQGYDGRSTGSYDAAKNITFPQALAVGDVIHKAIYDLLDGPDENSRHGLNGYTAFHVVSEAPLVGTTSPSIVGWPGRGTPSGYTIDMPARLAVVKAQMPYASWLDTSGIGMPTYSEVITKIDQVVAAPFQFDPQIGGGIYRSWLPHNIYDGQDYGENVAGILQGAILFALSDIPTDAQRENVFFRIISIGQNAYESMTGNSLSWPANGGHVQFLQACSAVYLAFTGQQTALDNMLSSEVAGNYVQAFEVTQAQRDAMVPHDNITGGPHTFYRAPITAVSGNLVTVTLTRAAGNAGGWPASNSIPNMDLTDGTNAARILRITQVNATPIATVDGDGDPIFVTGFDLDNGANSITLELENHTFTTSDKVHFVNAGGYLPEVGDVEWAILGPGLFDFWSPNPYQSYKSNSKWEGTVLALSLMGILPNVPQWQNVLKLVHRWATDGEPGGADLDYPRMNAVFQTNSIEALIYDRYWSLVNHGLPAPTLDTISMSNIGSYSATLSVTMPPRAGKFRVVTQPAAMATPTTLQMQQGLNGAGQPAIYTDKEVMATGSVDIEALGLPQSTDLKSFAYFESSDRLRTAVQELPQFTTLTSTGLIQSVIPSDTNCFTDTIDGTVAAVGQAVAWIKDSSPEANHINFPVAPILRQVANTNEYYLEITGAEYGEFGLGIGGDGITIVSAAQTTDTAVSKFLYELSPNFNNTAGAVICTTGDATDGWKFNARTQDGAGYAGWTSTIASNTPAYLTHVVDLSGTSSAQNNPIGRVNGVDALNLNSGGYAPPTGDIANDIMYLFARGGVPDANAFVGKWFGQIIYDSALDLAGVQAAETIIAANVPPAIPAFDATALTGYAAEFLPSDVSTLTLDSQNRLSGIADLSGNGNHAAQPSTLSMPYVGAELGGYNAIVCNGRQNQQYLPTTFTPSGGDAWFVAFVQFTPQDLTTGISSIKPVGSWRNGTSGISFGTRVVGGVAKNNFYTYGGIGSGVAESTATHDFQVGDRGVFIGQYSQNNFMRGYFNGTQVVETTEAADVAGAPGVFEVGGQTNDPGRRCAMVVSHVIAGNGILTDTERNDVTNHFARYNSTEFADVMIGFTGVSTLATDAGASQGVASTDNGAGFKFVAGGTAAENSRMIHIYDAAMGTLLSSFDTSTISGITHTQCNTLIFDSVNNKLYAGANNFSNTPMLGWLLEFDFNPTTGVLTHVATRSMGANWNEGGDFRLDATNGLEFFASDHNLHGTNRYRVSDWSFQEFHPFPLSSHYSNNGNAGGLLAQQNRWVGDIMYVNTHNSNPVNDNPPKSRYDAYKYNPATGEFKVAMANLYGPTDFCGQGFELKNGSTLWAERVGSPIVGNVVQATGVFDVIQIG